MMNHHRKRIFTGTSVFAVSALALSACGGSEETTETDAALEEGGTITVWAWEPTLDQVAEAFEAENEGVTVDLVNVGTGDEHYTNLQNAMRAGSGLPDVAQVEYFAIPQYILGESLMDLSEFGAGDYAEGTFSDGPWNAVTFGGEGIYGIPMDSGPIALFYNQDVFDEHDVEVPETWEEYEEAARQFREADDDVYITSDQGDAGQVTTMIWQAGGTPFSTEGTDVTVDLTGDEGTARWAEYWQPFIDDDLIMPVAGWTDEWYQALGDGSIASLTIGAWMPANLESGVPDGAGSWRVAPLPQWEAGESQTSEQGGSSLAIPEGAENAELAYEFMQFAGVDGGVQERLDSGAFPATLEDLQSEDFINREYEYFGNQQINQVLSESAQNVVDGWQYLPFQGYAHSVFNDTVGQAYEGQATLEEGLGDWQDDLTGYGRDQGFDIAE
ncbi:MULTISPECIES: sugar ABC transporter substrate-binding protein [unclassified Nesterenkonia]|uniref:ABC transporter substrate-binding protein n=1 Tax=unclassified Nesterenkonia TaxID=2629769 RepID=UPI002102D6C5|nr:MULTISPECIES: sugar ABC transporter substrate-binding protein [unclassified Nesterenkonia]